MRSLSPNKLTTNYKYQSISSRKMSNANKSDIPTTRNVGSRNTLVDPLSMRISFSQEMSHDKNTVSDRFKVNPPAQTHHNSSKKRTAGNTPSEEYKASSHRPLSNKEQQPQQHIRMNDSGIYDLENSESDSDEMMAAVASTRDLLRNLEYNLQDQAQDKQNASHIPVSPHHPSLLHLKTDTEHENEIKSNTFLTSTHTTQLFVNDHATPVCNIASPTISSAQKSVAKQSKPQFESIPLEFESNLPTHQSSNLINQPDHFEQQPIVQSSVDPHALWTQSLSTMSLSDLANEFTLLCETMAQQLATFNSIVKKNEQFYQDITVELGLHRQNVKQHREWLQVQQDNLIQRFQFLRDTNTI
ncbi:hypothetical protein QVD99_000856 [Batrachochytrium dendrobatidis]|nr:hypothetical protein QVD99_000856 [Batrachochytrium dendrobatidis]